MKRLVILAVTLAGLAAFVYYYEFAGKEARDKAGELEESVLQLDQEAIRSIEIHRLEKPTVVLERTDETWVLREPITTVADENTVDTLLRNLATAKRDRTFEEVGDSDLASYGLADPPLKIEVGTQDGRKTMLVGNKDFSGSKLYVKLESEPEVFLTSTLVESSANKTEFDWRSKDALDFQRDKVEEIEIRREDATIKLAKRDGDWFLTAPFQDAADTGKIGTILSTLEFAKAERFVEDAPASLGGYGLDQPRVSVGLREEGQDTWQHLELGLPDGDHFFARNRTRESVFTVAKNVHDDLTQDVQLLREMDVVDVKQDQIVELKIRRGEEWVSFHREDFKWTIEEPENLKGREALAYKFWYPIDDLKFAEMREEVNRPETPEIELIVTLTGGGERHYWFWQDEDVSLALRLEPERGGTITAEDFEKLLFKAEDLVEN